MNGCGKFATTVSVLGCKQRRLIAASYFIYHQLRALAILQVFFIERQQLPFGDFS
jgi:hypothetical protein